MFIHRGGKASFFDANILFLDVLAAAPDGSSLRGQKIGKKAPTFPGNIGKNTVNKPQLFMYAYA
jgi:hypothetical protein